MNVAAGAVLRGERKDRTLEGVVGTVDLVHGEGVGVHGGRRSLGLGGVGAEDHIGGVLVPRGANRGGGVQRARVGDDEAAVGIGRAVDLGQAVGGELQNERFAGVGDHGVVVREPQRHSAVGRSHLDGGGAKGDAGGKHVVQLDIRAALGKGDLHLVLDRVAEAGGGGVGEGRLLGEGVLVDGRLDETHLLGQGRDGVLVLDLGVARGGVDRAEGARGGGDEVVARLQALEGDGRAVGRLLAGKREHIALLDEGLDDADQLGLHVVARQDARHHLVVLGIVERGEQPRERRVVLDGVDEGDPGVIRGGGNRVAVAGVGVEVAVGGGDVEDLVDPVRLAHVCVGDRDGAGVPVRPGNAGEHRERHDGARDDGQNCGDARSQC